jgi:flagellar basal-body rod protein FlgF
MKTFEIAALAMQADQNRVTTVSQNLANVSTPGYKRKLDVQSPFAALLVPQQDAGGTASLAVSMPLAASHTSVDMAAGALRQTNNPLDIVAEGGGFLELRGEQGLSYARSASFHLDAGGHAVTAQGERLQMLGGDLKFNGSATELRVDAQGNVLAGTENIGRLRVVHFDKPSALTPLGNGQYQAGMASMTDDPNKTAVRTGYVEASNVQSTREMVKLMETTRHFEAMSKVFQGYDEMLEKSIRKFGEV